MKSEKFLSKRESFILRTYMFYTFFIAWGTEFLLIGLYKLGLLHGSIAQIFHFAIIGFGAGMAPAYAAYIVEKRESAVTLKVFCKQIFCFGNYQKSLTTLIVLALIQFGVCIIQETYLGNPLYFFVLFMPMMILGGGLEEIGWRGILQPILERHFSFLGATIIEGIIWSFWHLPLWFVPNTSQSTYNFIAFTLYCITLGLALAVAYRLTKSVLVTILLHAWGNTVLGGMYTLTSLTNVTIKTLIIYCIQILLILFYYKIVKRK